ncbi:hypothetical protein FRB93_012139 [Tulasnella sp. JGI-2019a]|nr:hypothetical protein FRB93_012139 [Tulasnella sp. JGI-2019a]
MAPWWLLPCQEITPFVSSIATVVPPKPPVADWHRSASTLAGTCIAADICFWTSQQAASSPMTQEELLPHFQHALDQYQKEKKDVIIQAICQIPDGLSDEDRSGAVKQLILQHGQFSPVAKARAL